MATHSSNNDTGRNFINCWVIINRDEILKVDSSGLEKSALIASQPILLESEIEKSYESSVIIYFTSLIVIKETSASLNRSQ
jgi:hypothetical protein